MKCKSKVHGYLISSSSECYYQENKHDHNQKKKNPLAIVWEREPLDSAGGNIKIIPPLEISMKVSQRTTDKAGCGATCL